MSATCTADSNTSGCSMSKSNVDVHCHEIVPGLPDIDHMGHVNNAVYLRWVQDAVLGQWRAIATTDAFTKHLWIALRHEIDYRRRAFLGDMLNVVATLTRVRDAKAHYDTTIQRRSEVLAKVLSCWCSVDALTRKPLRLLPSSRLFCPRREARRVRQAGSDPHCP